MMPVGAIVQGDCPAPLQGGGKEDRNWIHATRIVQNTTTLIGIPSIISPCDDAINLVTIVGPVFCFPELVDVRMEGIAITIAVTEAE